MLERVLYPLFRRVDFRGKGRLRARLPVPAEGVRTVAFPGGFRLRLDLRQSLQRDFLFGLYDRFELELVRRELAGGGDFVDVGAHVGMYTVAAALVVRGRGRVLAFEPNPAAREQLLANVALNRCEDAVVVVASAAADVPGETLLHVPASPDPSFSSLEGGRFEEAEPVRVPVTTVDAEVAAHGLRPRVVKIDVEGGELRVLAGMERTLDERPTLLVEVGPETGPEAEAMLGARGYAGYRVERGKLRPCPEQGVGLFNAVFVPR